MTDEQKAYNSLLDGIKYAVESATSQNNGVNIVRGLVVSQGTNKGYKVKINGQNIDDVPYLIQPSVNRTVVCLCNGNLSNLFILGTLTGG